MNETDQFEDNSGKKPAWRWAIWLALVHIVFATLYAASTPYLTPGRIFVFTSDQKNGTPTDDIGAPDELQHIVQISRIASGEPYPTLKVGDPKLDFYYQAHQPPVFYYLAAGWVKLVGASETQKLAPYIAGHTAEETKEALKPASYAASRTALDAEAVRVRFLNVLIGALGVVGVFALGLWGYSERVGIAAATFAALLPMNIALSAAVSNDPLLICLCTWCCALIIGALKTHLCWKRASAIGILVGLAFLTKTTALAIAPAAIAAFVFHYWAVKPRRFVPLLIIAGVALVIGGSWWGRNMSVYGEPFAVNTFNEAFGNRSPRAEPLVERLGAGAYWQAVFETTAQSTVGMFSYMDILMPRQLYTLAWAAMGGFGLLGLISLRGKFGAATGANLVLGLVVVFLFYSFNKVFFQGQGRYLLPAIGAFSCLLGLGFEFLESKSKSQAVMLIWIVLWGAIAAGGYKTLNDEFPRRVAPVEVTGLTSD